MHHGTLEHEGAWSFGDSRKCEWYILPNKEVPASRAHQFTQSTTVPAWTIGKAARSTQPSTTAGVGDYELNMSTIYASSQKPTIGNQGKRVRSPRIRSVLPINPKIQMIKPQAPAFSLGYKIDTEYNNGLPGPGDYQKTSLITEPSFNRTDNYFTTSKKIDPTFGRIMPGVGDYNITGSHFDNAPVHRFGTADRPEPGLNNCSPGIYYFTQGAKEGGISIGQMLPVSFIKMNVPPPTKYNVAQKNKYDKRREKSMYTSKRSQCINQTSTTLASPGSYELSTDISAKKGRKFEKSQRDRPSSSTVNIPGPGSYEHRSQLNKTFGRMRWKHPKRIEFQTPAPNSYITQPATTRHKSQYSRGMPVSLRPNVEKSTTNDIGPGQYQIQTRLRSESGSIGRNPRRCVTTTNNPGPGQYDIPTTIGRIPKYFKRLNKKINEFGDTTIIKYDPKSFTEIKLAVKAPEVQLQN